VSSFLIAVASLSNSGTIALALAIRPFNHALFRLLETCQQIIDFFLQIREV
jgi:hypothetical protein